MTVAYVVGEFPSISETFILRELLALDRKGIKVAIFSLNRPSSERMHTDAEPLLGRVTYRQRPPGFRTILSQLYFLVTAPRRYLALLWNSLARGDTDRASTTRGLYHLATAADFALEAQRLRVSRVHAHFAFVTADIGSMMAELLDARFSVSVHASDIFAQKRQSLGERIQKASAVVSCTEYGRDHLRQLFPWMPENRILTIHHGVFPDQYAIRQPAEPAILGVGRLEEKKGFRDLVAACVILKERGISFRCVIAGNGTLRQSLEAEIARSGLEDAFSLPGELTQAELMKLYQNAAILAVPSVVTQDGDRDGLPNVIMEAMAMGIPVVATSASAIPEILENDVNGLLVPPDDPVALADALQKLLADAALRGRMGSKGRETVCRDFDISSNIDRLVALFNDKNA